MESNQQLMSLDSLDLETYDILSAKNVPSLSDVELFIDDYTLVPPPQPHSYFIPEVWSSNGPPSRACFPGPYDFKVEVNSSDVNKNKYLYSHRLHRIYVDMEYDFSLYFNWSAATATAGGDLHTMFVRATVVFTEDAQAEKRVERCTQHYYQNPEQQARPELQNFLKNVLHSSRELGSSGVEYCGSVATDDSWFSVRVELTKTSEQSIAHAYKFVCKNSCPNGINRRAISIIFTLEDKNNRVYGRTMLGARVCACPRRDMHKDDTTVRASPAAGELGEGKRLAGGAPRPKKIKREANTDPALLTLPPLRIVGTRAVVTGLEVMVNMMKQALEQNPATTEPYTASIAEAQAYIDQCKAQL